MNIPAVRRRGRKLVAITPLIDVVFILLFFFMLASRFDQWRAMDLSLSATAGTAPSTSESRVVRVRAGGQVQWQDDWLAPAELVVLLRPADASVALLLQPLPGTPIQDLVSVMEAIRADGRHPVSLAVGR